MRGRSWWPSVALLILQSACGGRVLPPEGSRESDLAPPTVDASLPEAPNEGGAPDVVADSTNETRAVGSDSTADVSPPPFDSDGAIQPLDAAQRACDDYRSIWIRYRVASPFSPCGQCFARTGSMCPAVDQDPCGGTLTCMARNCTCTNGEQRGDCASTPVPKDMCACLDSCLPNGASVCRDRWLQNMACVDSMCLSVCSG
jgi:hypothetical protein